MLVYPSWQVHLPDAVWQNGTVDALAASVYILDSLGQGCRLSPVLTFILGCSKRQTALT